MRSAPVHPCEAALASLPQDVLVGVSGGIDSVALLHALTRTGRRPVVLHFNHGWRAEKANEERAVRALARKLELRILTGRARTTRRTEAVARAQRYAFFSRAAGRLGRSDLVLAHHADDQVETFLLQLLRGAGSGARGMEEQANRAGLVLHRPWLGLWKKEITAYARARRLDWQEDATNTDTRHRRNLVRHRLLPYLERLFGPGAAERLWRAAEVAREESAWLDALCSADAAQDRLSVRSLRTMAVGQQRRVLLRWLQNRGVADLAFADVENVRRLLESAGPARVNLSQGRFARRRAGLLFIEEATGTQSR